MIQAALRSAAGIVRHRVTGRPVPLNVMVSLTDACNAHCAYCDIPGRGHDDRPASAIIADLAALAHAGACRVGLWGGEPLLRDDVGEIVRAAKRLGYWVSLDTNGWLYPKRQAEVADADHVLFSLDGLQAGHDRVRGKGSFPKVMRALDHAAAVGQPFWTITVLGAHNLDDIDAVVDLVEARGGHAAFQLLHHPPELTGGRGADLFPGNNAYRAALRHLLDLRRAGRPVGMSEAAIRQLLDWPDYRIATLPVAPDRGPCLAGQLYCNLDADGRLYPCSLRVGAQPGVPLEGGDASAAMAAMDDPGCAACIATCFTEYNLLYGGDPAAAIAWLRALLPHAPPPAAEPRSAP